MMALLRELPMSSERWWACQKPHGERVRIRRMRMKANRIYIVAVVVTSGRIIQCKDAFRFYDIKLLASTSIYSNWSFNRVVNVYSGMLTSLIL
jgi:hypothetical protein